MLTMTFLALALFGVLGAAIDFYARLIRRLFRHPGPRPEPIFAPAPHPIQPQDGSHLLSPSIPAESQPSGEYSLAP